MVPLRSARSRAPRALSPRCVVRFVVVASLFSRFCTFATQYCLISVNVCLFIYLLGVLVGQTAKRLRTVTRRQQNTTHGKGVSCADC